MDNAALFYFAAHTELEQKLRGYGSERYDVYWYIATSHAKGYFEPGKAVPLMEYLEPSLIWVRRGAAMEDCVWANQFWEKPPYQVTPHWGMIRDLCRVMVVSGMAKNEQGDLAGSTEDLLVALNMPRHVVSESTVLPLLIQLQMDATPREALALQLDRYDRAGLERLCDRLGSVRPLVPMSACVDAERDAMRWLWDIYEAQGVGAFTAEFNRLYDASQLLQSVSFHRQAREQERVFFVADRAEKRVGKIHNATAAQIDRWREELDAIYREAHDIMRAEPEEMPALIEENLCQFDSPNPVVRLLAPAFAIARRAEMQQLSRRGMLDAVIAYRLGGEAAFNTVVDPWDGKPYDRALTEEGLVLTSRMPEEMVGSRWPLKMVFARGCARPLAD